MKYFVVFLFCVTLAVHCRAKPKPKPKVQGDRLSDAEHYSKGGEHDHAYDHEAFLGKDQAEQFKELTPEESKRRLG